MAALPPRPSKIHHLAGSGRYAVAVTDGQELPIRFLMYRAFRAAEDQILSQLHDRGFADLSRAQHQLLVGLRSASTTQTAELAEHAGLAGSTATALLNRLGEAGYVTVAPDGSSVELAERGHQALQATHAAELQIVDDWTSLLGTDGIDQLQAGLTRINDALP